MNKIRNKICYFYQSYEPNWSFQMNFHLILCRWYQIQQNLHKIKYFHQLDYLESKNMICENWTAQICIEKMKHEYKIILLPLNKSYKNIGWSNIRTKFDKGPTAKLKIISPHPFWLASSLILGWIILIIFWLVIFPIVFHNKPRQHKIGNPVC